MNRPVDAPSDLGLAYRMRMAVLAGACFGVLMVARWLDPAPVGFGTHQQLGLGGCTFLELAGHPCPMCGATTTFALLADGFLGEGFRNQPFAAVLFLLTVAATGISLSEVIQPRARWARVGKWVEPIETQLAMIFVAALFVGWTYKVWMMAH